MVLWFKLLEFSWTLYWGCFLSLPVVTDSSGWFLVHPAPPPSVAWQREVFPWCSVGGMSACPIGAAMPLGSSVLRSSWPSRWDHRVSGWACGLPQPPFVKKTFPHSGGLGSCTLCGVPYIWLALCSSACVSPGDCPSFSQVGPAHSHWVPLLWAWCA